MTIGAGAEFPKARAGEIPMTGSKDVASLKAKEVAATDQYEAAKAAFEKKKDVDAKVAFQKAGVALRAARQAYREAVTGEGEDA